MEIILLTHQLAIYATVAGTVALLLSVVALSRR